MAKKNKTEDIFEGLLPQRVANILPGNKAAYADILTDEPDPARVADRATYFAEQYDNQVSYLRFLGYSEDEIARKMQNFR